MSNYEEQPNRGAIFTHKRNMHPDLMGDGSITAQGNVECPHCRKSFAASIAFFINLWRAKSEKVMFNIQLKQKQQQGASAPAERPASNFQKPMNFNNPTAPAGRSASELDDEIPF
jgi:hypothetical protein